MTEDPYKDYFPETPPGKEALSYAWKTAIGLQDVDGLKPSEYLIETANKNIAGEIDISQAQDLVSSYYESKSQANSSDARTEEADKVAARIAKLLQENGFSLSPQVLCGIHGQLFAGIYNHAGAFRKMNISKKEWVLDGATVIYGNAADISKTLDYDIAPERDFNYAGLDQGEVVSHLARFVANLWQVHPFAEGNTRTVAVFFIKYLRSLGFAVENDLFEENSWYFRNALVRANFNDLQNGVHETT